MANSANQAQGPASCSTQQVMNDHFEEVTQLDAVFINAGDDTIEYRELISDTVHHSGATDYAPAPNGAYDQNRGLYYNVAAGGNLRVWDIENLAAGSTPVTITPAVPNPVNINYGAYDPTTGLLMFGAQQTDRWTLNPNTGVRTILPPISGISGGQLVSSISIDRQGRMWAASYQSSNANNAGWYRVDKGTGVATLLGPLPEAMNGHGVDISQDELGWVGSHSINGGRIYRWTEEDASDAEVVATTPQAGNTLDVVKVTVAKTDQCFMRCTIHLPDGTKVISDTDSNGDEYTPMDGGTIQLCSDPVAQEQQAVNFLYLCDVQDGEDPVPFLRRIITNTLTGDSITRDYQLDATSAYVVGGTAMECTDECCAVRVAEGCIDGGGRWVTFRLDDGSYETVNAATGETVLEADQLVECPREAYLTTLNSMPQNTNFTIPGDGVSLTGWSVRALTTPVNLVLNSGTAVAMNAGEEFNSQAHADDGVLDDVVAVATGAGGTARVIYQNRQ